MDFNRDPPPRTDMPNKPTLHPDLPIQTDQPPNTQSHHNPRNAKRGTWNKSSVADNMSQEMKSYGTVIDVNSHHSVSHSRFGSTECMGVNWKVGS